MGQVYQATDTKLNRQVALKILPEAFADDPDRLARFQREAQVLASLNHPNIAAIRLDRRGYAGAGDAADRGRLTTATTGGRHVFRVVTRSCSRSCPILSRHHELRCSTWRRACNGCSSRAGVVPTIRPQGTSSMQPTTPCGPCPSMRIDWRSRARRCRFWTTSSRSPPVRRTSTSPQMARWSTCPGAGSNRRSSGRIATGGPCRWTCPSVLLPYGTAEEAIALSRQRIALGERLAYIYPPLPELDRPGNLLVPTSLYGRLNDKGQMSELVTHSYLPSRFVVSVEELNRLKGLPATGRPVFVKASVEEASGGGRDVRYCPDRSSWSSAISWFQEKSGELAGVVVEDAIDVRTCWCMGVSILDSSCCYLGSAIQTFDRPGKQNGNRVDSNNAPSEQAVQIALSIADRAREEGYRGIAGFDIGINTKGKLFVFDLNFRLTACTGQLLLHENASERIGARISQTWKAEGDFALSDALERLRPFVEKGVFIPTRSFDRDTYLETSHEEQAVSLVKALFMTVWRPSTRSAEHSCGSRQG